MAYAFEAVMINEFSGRSFPCSDAQIVPFGPDYANLAPDQASCTVVGSVAGVFSVEGDAYIGQSFQYYRSHLWR